MTQEQFEKIPLDKKMEYLRNNLGKEQTDVPDFLKDLMNKIPNS